mmetsp:Transcript_61611/g.170800  ORF Transcript_61611/g.170800 Transcript_61611/m.170800 type:complete len:204 (-) Transcript_61611:723-1334(-)
MAASRSGKRLSSRPGAPPPGSPAAAAPDFAAAGGACGCSEIFTSPGRPAACSSAAGLHSESDSESASDRDLAASWRLTVAANSCRYFSSAFAMLFAFCASNVLSPSFSRSRSFTSRSRWRRTCSRESSCDSRALLKVSKSLSVNSRSSVFGASCSVADPYWKRSVMDANSAPCLYTICEHRSNTDCCTAVQVPNRMPSMVGCV